MVLTGASSKMPMALTPAEEFIHAFCGKQTSETSRPRTYSLQAEDLLLCSFGASPRASSSSSANCSTHAGAARWLQRTTVPLSENTRSLSENGCRRASSAPPGAGISVFARCSSMTDCPDAAHPTVVKKGDLGPRWL